MRSSLQPRKILRYVLVTVLIVALACPALALELGTGSPATGTAAISNGDPVILHGIATGHPREGLQVWVIGNNYLKISTISVNDDNTFEFELRSSDTQNLASGQYFVVVQHPMMNGQFDVYYDSASGRVINRQMGTGGTSIFQMSGSGSLQGPASAQALVNAISSQDIDDTFTTYTFLINPPAAFINPVGDHAVGDRITISGSTNLAVGDQLTIEVTSSSFSPTNKATSGEFSGASGVVEVVAGSGGYNRWYFDLDTSTFRPDEYAVIVSGIIVDVRAYTTFTLHEKPAPAPATTVATPAETLVTVTMTSMPESTATPTLKSPLPESTATPTPKSPLPAGIGILALAVVIAGKRAGW